MRLQLPLSPAMNIVLVGMAGAGKSTVGVVLAKQAARGFVDSDLLIEVREGKLLQTILDESDHLNLRRIEREVLLGLQLQNHVIATGGSAVYSEAAMGHLRETGAVVFLDVELDEIIQRVSNVDNRGIACRPGLTLREIYRERRPLYLRWADIRVDCGRLGHEAVAARILKTLGLSV